MKKRKEEAHPFYLSILKQDGTVRVFVTEEEYEEFLLRKLKSLWDEK